MKRSTLRTKTSTAQNLGRKVSQLAERGQQKAQLAAPGRKKHNRGARTKKKQNSQHTDEEYHFSCIKVPIPALIKKITMCNKEAIDFFRLG